MAVRKETAQLTVEIRSVESAEYQKMLKSQKDAVTNIRKLEAGTDEYNKALQDTINKSKEFSNIDINKLSSRQLKERSRQLERMKQLYPQNSAGLRQLEMEQKKLNDALANARSRTRGVADGMKNAEKTGGSFTAFIKRSIPLLTAFFALGKLVEWGKGLLTLGTEIDVFDRKFKTVFGESGDIVEGFAEQNARSLGLTEQQYRTAAAAVGDLLIPMGFQRDVGAQMSSELVNLSGALSEWTGGQKSAKDVADILSKAVLGEREQLKTLGIAIREADVQARLAAKGQKELTGQQLEQAKAIATYELILEKSTDAQNAFANNTDSLIRKKNDLKAKLMENVEAFAKRLIPVWNKAVVMALSLADGAIQIALSLKQIPKFIKDNKIELIALTATILAFNTQAIASNAAIIGQRIAMIRATVAQKAHLLSWRGLNAVIKANPIGFIIGLIASLTVAITQAYKKSQTFRGVLFGIGETAKELFLIVKEAIGGFVDGFKQLAEGNITDGLKSIGQSLVKSNPIGIALTEGKRLKEAFGRGFQEGEVDFQTEQDLNAEGERQAAELAAIDNQSNSTNISPVAIAINPDSTGGTSTEGPSTEDQIKEALAEKQAFYDRLALIDEIQRQDALARAQGNEELMKQINAEARQEEIDLQAAHFQDQLAILEEHGEEQSNKYLEIQAKLAELKNQEAELERQRLEEINQQVLADLARQEEQDALALERKFENALISEQEFAELKLEQEVAQIENRLVVLEELGLRETEVYRRTEMEKTAILKQQGDQRVQYEQQLQQSRLALQNAQLDAASAFLNTTIGLLGKENKARKQFFLATKAFEIAKVIINLQSQISAIYAKYAAIPYVGIAIASAEAAAAKITAGIQIGTIAAQTFQGLYKGGLIEPYEIITGRRVTESPNAPTQPGGDNVLAFLKPGEVVLNGQQQEYFGGPQAFRSAGVPGFNDGGLVTVNTTPAARSDVSFAPQGSSEVAEISEDLRALTSAILNQSQRPIRTYVAITDVEDASDELNEIRDAASI